MNTSTIEFSLLSSFEELQKNLLWYNLIKKEIKKVYFPIAEFMQEQQFTPFPDEHRVNSPVTGVAQQIQSIVAPMLSLTERYPWILQDTSSFSDETIDFLNTKILFPSIESDPKVNPLKTYEEKIKSLDRKSLDKPLNKENLCQMVSEMEQVSEVIPRKIHQPIKEIISRCGSYLLQHPEIKEFLEVSGAFLGIVISIMQIISSQPTVTKCNINYNPKTIINIDSDDLEKIVAISDRVIKDQSEILSQFIESLNSNNE